MGNKQTAKLVRWLCPDGGTVRQGQPICEIETDKASVEIAAPKSGILRQLAKVGDMVGTDVDIARIDRDE